VRYAFRRALLALLAWALSCLGISAILNSTLEATARADILESVAGIAREAGPAELAGRTPGEYREELRLSLERARGLHLPLAFRVLRSWLSVLSLDLGSSGAFWSGSARMKVRQRVLEAAGSTLSLYVSSNILAIGLGLALTLRAARNPRGLLDRALVPLGTILSGAPPWWIGQFLVMALAIEWRLFPFGALATVPPPDNPFLAFLDRASDLVLPGASIAFARVWGFAWLARTAMDSSLHEDFVMSARGRGIPETRVIGGHVLRSSAPAILSTGALALVQSFGGDVLVEIVFARPGLGLLLWRSIRGNDLNLAAGTFAALAFLLCASMALIDLAYGAVDPRIQAGRR
jgi:peptide/nickel transport system permease protein